MSTEVIIQPTSTRPLYRKVVRDGKAGNLDVIFEMIRLVRNDVDYDKGVETVAKNILVERGLDSYSPAQDQLQAVFDFIVEPTDTQKHRILYIQDIAGRVESLKDARTTLSDGWGDCDDQAVLNATLLGCLGFEDVKIAMARYSANDDNFAHVYCVVYDHGKRYVFDTNLPNPQLDKEVKPFEVKEIAVFSDDPALKGWSGIYHRVRNQARKTARLAAKAVPSLGMVVPMGFVADHVLTAGMSMMQGAGNRQPMSLSNTASTINRSLDKIILDLTSGKIAYDLAKTYALQDAAQLMAVDIKADDEYTLQVVKESIKNKLNFIKDFPAYAEANGIRVVHLHSGMMLLAGGALAAGAAYTVYQYYKGRQ